MMCGDTELVRRAAHVLTSRGGRVFLDGIGYKSGAPIVVLAANERLDGVCQRVRTANADMVLLAVWFPLRQRFLLLHVSREQSATVRETLEADSMPPLTIGMLLDDLSKRDADTRDAVRVVAEHLCQVKVSEISDTPVNA